MPLLAAAPSGWSTRLPSIPGIRLTSSARSAISTAHARPSTGRAPPTASRICSARESPSVTGHPQVRCVSFNVVNRVVPWHRLPHSGLLNLSVYRDKLRAKNLLDTENVRLRPGPAVPSPSRRRCGRSARTTAVTTILPIPKWSARLDFRPHDEPVYRPDTFDQPDPILVSRELMTRKAFIPARS